MAIMFSLVAAAFTFGGGLIALRYRDRFHLILGLTGGIIMGVITFDLLPEIHEMAEEANVDIKWPMGALLCGFLLFHVLEKVVLVHHAHEDEYGRHTHPNIGIASALALAGHSLADGIAIGVAFKLDHAIGAAVTVAVLSHDLADGLNTVTLMLRHGNGRRRALLFLAIDAVMPIAGALIAVVIAVPMTVAVIYLGVFTGFLLYLGASDILPEAHARHPSVRTLGMTVAGAAAMYFVSIFI